MKIIYVNSNSWDNKSADIIQSLNTVSSLSEKVKIIYLSGFVSKNVKKECYNFFNIKQNFIHKRMPVKISTSNFLIEKITRLFFCILTFIYLKVSKFDIIYTRDFSFLFFLSKIPYFLKIKKKIFFEAHKIYHKASMKVNFNQEKKSLSNADYFIANSDGTKNGLIKYFKINEKNINVIHNGVNLSVFSKRKINKNYLSDRYKIKNDEAVILYSGSFLEWKGVEYLIYAFDFLKDKKYKLILVGGSGKDKDRILDIIKNLGYQDKIVVDGFIDQNELLNIMTLADIAVLPNKKTIESEEYTSPVKTFEYMAMGLPIIAAKLPALTDILKADENCIFFEPENSKDLANKIILLMNDSVLRKKISKNNSIKAIEYSWENRAGKIMKFIDFNLKF